MIKLAYGLGYVCIFAGISLSFYDKEFNLTLNYLQVLLLLKLMRENKHLIERIESGSHTQSRK